MITSDPSLAMLLLLCISVHACTARSISLSLTRKDNPHKELVKVKLLETLSASCVKNYKLHEYQPQQQKVSHNEVNNSESCSSSVSSTLKETILEAAASVKVIPSDGGGRASGTSFQMDSPFFLTPKDERKHARSMVGSFDEEKVVTNGSDTEEDMVEMDYAQPHRKPPIHNEKP